MAMRTPTPELIDAVHYDYEKHDAHDRHARRLVPGWGWALGWALLIAVAIMWRLSNR